MGLRKCRGEQIKGWLETTVAGEAASRANAGPPWREGAEVTNGHSATAREELSSIPGSPTNFLKPGPGKRE